jgi:hypothetical protein
MTRVLIRTAGFVIAWGSWWGWLGWWRIGFLEIRVEDGSVGVVELVDGGGSFIGVGSMG